MISYVVISGTDFYNVGETGPMALVVTDGTETVVYGDSDIAQGLRDDGEFPISSDRQGVLRIGLTGMSAYKLDGPNDYRGSIAISGPLLAESFGL